MNTIFQQIGTYRVVPVIAIEDPEAAVPLADALMEGGLPVAEVTFRTMAAAAVIEKWRAMAIVEPPAPKQSTAPLVRPK